MTLEFQNPRASSYIASDDIPTLQFRRSSRKFSEIKTSNDNGLSASSQELLESFKPAGEDENTDELEYTFKEEYYSPEGLWGWLIVAAAFCTNFVVDGISLSYGVMTEKITEKIIENDGNGTETSEPGAISIAQFNIVGSMTLAVTLMMGSFASVFTEKFGFRSTAMCGSAIATLGIFLSWAISPSKPNFWAFVIGFGLLAGVGFGIMFTASIVIVGLYFNKNRALATGIVVAGTGVGTLTMAPVMNKILEIGDGGWQGAIWFQTGLCALSVLFASVYRPIPKRVMKRRKSEVMRSGVDVPVKEQLKWLCTSPSYLLLSFSGSLVMMGYFAPFGFLVDSASEIIGKQKAVNLLMFLGITNACGRVLVGLLANKIGHSLLISNVALTVGGLVTALYPFANSQEWLIVCAIIFGIYSAVFASMRSIVIMNIVGEQRFNVGFGLSLVFMGVATLFSNTLGGYLKDTTENYDMSFYVAGGFLMLSAVICYPLPCIINYETRMDEQVFSKHLASQRRSLVDIHVNH